MMLLQNDGTLIWTGAPTNNAGRTRGTIALPIDLVDQQSDLIDGVFAFAFDVLGLHTLELRIRPYQEETHACDPEDSVSRSGGWPSKGSKLLCARPDTDRQHAVA